MSYILDALRKSDHQRKRGVPLLLAAQAAASVPRQPPRLLYGSIALVLLGAGVAIGWLRPWQQEPELPATRVAVKPAAAVANAAAPAAPEVSRPAQEVQSKEMRSMALVAPKEDAEIETASPPARQQAVTRSSKKVVKQAPAPRAGEVAAIESQVVSQPPEAQAAAQNATTRSSRDDTEARAQSVVAMNELPVSIQKDLPPMSIMVHAYSEDPAKRLVGINNRLLHEGDEVAPGLKLERITLDGMILSYKGYSFHRGVR